MRSLVNRGFTPRRIAALEPRIRAIARAALDAVESKGEFDLVHDLAIPLPVTVIAEMLGVESRAARRFQALVRLHHLGRHRRGGRPAPREPARRPSRS